MAKLEDLDADGGPGAENPRAEADVFLQRLDEMLEDGDYLWAADTLQGIRETVDRSGLVSDGQRRAVTNIREARRRDTRGQDDMPEGRHRHRTGGLLRSIQHKRG